MTSDLTSMPPAGWYDDPTVAGGRRYWTGEAWAPSTPTAPQVEYPWQGTAAPVSSPIAVWAFVLGLIAVLLFWVPLLYLVTSIGGGIVAIVLARRARRLRIVNRSLATAGLALGIVGVSLAGINGLVGAVLGIMRAIS